MKTHLVANPFARPARSGWLPYGVPPAERHPEVDNSGSIGGAYRRGAAMRGGGAGMCQAVQLYGIANAPRNVTGPPRGEASYNWAKKRSSCAPK